MLVFFKGSILIALNFETGSDTNKAITNLVRNILFIFAINQMGKMFNLGLYVCARTFEYPSPGVEWDRLGRIGTPG